MGWKWKLDQLWTDENSPLKSLRSGSFGKWFKAKTTLPNVDAARIAQRRLTLVYGLCAYMVHVAQADGAFDERERSLIRQICLELNTELETGLGVEDISNLIDIAMNSKHAIPKIIHEAKGDLKLRYALLRYAWRVAARDGHITELEFQNIINLGGEMRAGGQEMLAASAPFYRPKGDAAVRRAATDTLDLPPTATPEEIENRFRELTLKYHPDLYKHVSDDIRALIHEKFTIISKAHAELIKRQEKHIYYAKFPHQQRTFSAVRNDEIECFFCHAIWRLPDAEFQSEDLRCGECQALLFFEADLADIFIH